MKKGSLVVSIFLSLAITPVQAANLTVGVESITYLPFSDVQGKQLKGFYRELLDKFARDSGHTISYRPLPIKRLTNDFVNGKVDFKIPDNKVWAKSIKAGKDITYSIPITTYTDGIIVKPANKGKPYDELRSIVTVRGFTPFPFMKDIAKGTLKVSEANSLDSVVKMVGGGRVKGGFVNVTVAKYFLDNVLNEPGMLVYDDSLPKGISEISLSSINQPSVIQEFNQWMSSNSAWISNLKAEHKVE